MHRRSQPATRSVLITRPTNAFYGLYTAYCSRDFVLLFVALNAILAEVLPILLSNVPFSLNMTYLVNVTCIRASMAILFIMIITVACSFFVTWPHMPLDPRSLVGMMFYVIDPRMRDNFIRLCTVKQGRRVEVRDAEMHFCYMISDEKGKVGLYDAAFILDDYLEQG